MKKWFIGVFILALVVLISYLLLPSRIVVKQAAFVNASAQSSYRSLTEEAMIQKWWGLDSTHLETKNEVPFSNNNWQYQFTPLVYNGVKVNMKEGNKSINSVIAITALNSDSSFLEWKAEWPQTHNPIVRIQQYWQARQVKKNMAEVMQQFSAFINKPEKLYGLQIKKTKVTDTLIATTKKIFKNYPTPEEYYTMIEDLQHHISLAGAQATNYPMLNISPFSNNEYGVMVGLPVNKVIPENNNIQLKRMIPGNILVAEMTGGPHRIEAAMREMRNYIQENDLLPPAIPYQSLVTDRKAEPDTNKWVTRLYFPVY